MSAPPHSAFVAFRASNVRREMFELRGQILIAVVRTDLSDTAPLGADLELQYRSGLFLCLRSERQFGAGTTAAEGMGSFGLHW